jgi:hypothetical protein
MDGKEGDEKQRWKEGMKARDGWMEGRKAEEKEMQRRT